MARPTLWYCVHSPIGIVLATVDWTAVSVINITRPVLFVTRDGQSRHGPLDSLWSRSAMAVTAQLCDKHTLSDF